MFLAVKEIQVIHCICSKVIDKHKQAVVCSAVSGYFAVNISFFATIVSLFGAGAAPFLTAPAPAPAPAPHPCIKPCEKQALFTSFRDFTAIFRILFFDRF